MRGTDEFQKKSKKNLIPTFVNSRQTTITVILCTAMMNDGMICNFKECVYVSTA